MSDIPETEKDILARTSITREILAHEVIRLRAATEETDKRFAALEQSIKELKGKTGTESAGTSSATSPRKKLDAKKTPGVQMLAVTPEEATTTNFTMDVIRWAVAIRAAMAITGT